jgi:hypothetical protein
MSDVQRWAPFEPMALMGRHPDGAFVRYADHARIVAEAVAEVTDALIASKRGALAEMEQAHAAALAAAAHTSTERLIAAFDRGYIEGQAAAPRILTRDGWWPFGSFVDYDFPLEFDGEGEDGLPIWERPDKSRMQPRTLTAADPGYHSQRCLHCDHIRATHTLTAHGCIGHALPGRPGADCPCAEFIHDGEDRYSRLGREASETMTAMDARRAAIHDGEATPEVKPCSTCGEPVAYLTARPGWAGGWLHHPARPLDGHPAAIDGEVTR